MDEHTAAPARMDSTRRLDPIEIRPLLVDATPIHSIETDNDKESWFLTRAGQFVRVTGEDLDRCYVMEADEAHDMIGEDVADHARIFPDWTGGDQQNAIRRGWKLVRGKDAALEPIADATVTPLYRDEDGPRRILERIEEGANAPWHMRRAEIELCRKAHKAIADTALPND